MVVMGGFGGWAHCMSAVAAIVVAAVLPQTAALSWDYPNFANAPSLSLNGDAKVQDFVMLLTAAEPNMAGAAWFTEAVDPVAGFSTYFQFRIDKNGGGGSSVVGGSGLAFVLQGEGPYALGRGASGLGYAGIRQAFVIEFDTHPDKDLGEPAEQEHISIHDSTSSGLPVTANENAVKHTLIRDFDRQKLEQQVARTGGGRVRLPLFTNGATHLVNVEYNPPMLSVYVDAHWGKRYKSVEEWQKVIRKERPVLAVRLPHLLGHTHPLSGPKQAGCVFFYKWR